MVSIIVAAFNAEDFLPKAIASVLEQSESDWELLLVDDGSTDSTGRLCDEAAEHDPRIRAIHKPNGGLSDARNAGLAASKGEWITFLDADDALTPDALTTMLRAAETTGAELVCADFHPSPDASMPQDEKARYGRETLEGEEACRRMLYQRGLNSSAWGKLYSRRLWGETRFPVGCYYEDLDMIHRVVPGARKVAAVPEKLYLYRIHEASFLHRFSRHRLDMLDVCDRMCESVARDYPGLLPAALERRLSAAFNMYGLLTGQDAATRGEYAGEIRRCEGIIRRWRGRVLLDRKVRLKSRLGILASYVGGFRLLRFLMRRVY